MLGVGFSSHVKERVALLSPCRRLVVYVRQIFNVTVFSVYVVTVVAILNLVNNLFSLL